MAGLTVAQLVFLFTPTGLFFLSPQLVNLISLFIFMIVSLLVCVIMSLPHVAIGGSLMGDCKIS